MRLDFRGTGVREQDECMSARGRENGLGGWGLEWVDEEGVRGRGGFVGVGMRE